MKTYAEWAEHDGLTPLQRDLIAMHWTAPQMGFTRVYHVLDHLVEVRRVLEEICVPSRAEVLAVYLHDLVYLPGAANNELLSAGFVDVLFPLEDVAVRDAARSLILATRTHEFDAVSQNLVAADLAVLCLPWTGYNEYVHAVRREYGAYSESAWRIGRMKWLRGMLDRARIVPLIEDRQAYANLGRELGQMEMRDG
jgi:predicted metal-dependent HD superfamily phosphohydrolase